jgi:hypothetical protein
MLHIYASVSSVFICMLQVFHLDVYICLQWLHTCFQVFSGVLQVFQTYVTCVSAVSDVCCKCSFGCCKSRSGVAYVAIRVRNEESASGPCARSGGTGIVRGGVGPAWACEM